MRNDDLRHLGLLRVRLYPLRGIGDGMLSVGRIPLAFLRLALLYRDRMPALSEVGVELVAVFVAVLLLDIQD
jgi:hypothetical protein